MTEAPLRALKRGTALLPLTFALWSATSGVALAQSISLKSPNGNIQVTVNPSVNSPLTYTVQFHGKTVLAPSTLGVIVDGQDLGQNVSSNKPTIHEKKENYTTVGVHRTAVNYYREAIIDAVGGPSKTKWTLELRVFNDGVAYRYRVPGTGKHRINGEDSLWKLPPGCTLWSQDDHNRAYEAPYLEAQVDTLKPGFSMAVPATVKLPGNAGYAMLTEANLVDYSDMTLKLTDSGTFQAQFPDDSQGWSNEGEIVSPWRVTLLADDLNMLVNSDIVQNLCPPPARDLAGAKWIQPGRSVWHWMVTGNPKREAQRQWVDWTKQLGFEYYLIDDGWVRWRDGDRDQWACLKDVVDYATSQGVRIFAWVNSDEVRTEATRKAYFEKAKAAGVVGLKIDFPETPSASTVRWYEDTLRDLAKYQLMVDFHGAVKPTGRERTWPQEVTREAIFGRESGKLPGLHDTALPFVRYVQGHADFTPTDFRLDRLHGSHWSHELAQAIVYTSPFLCYSGSPETYLSNPAIDVLKAIPSTWDQTVVLPGSEIGKVAGFARRKGNEWFIGIINGDGARSMPIDLSFLGSGQYHIEKFADTPERLDGWNHTEGNVTRKDKFTVDMLDNGGFVARLVPVK